VVWVAWDEDQLVRLEEDCFSFVAFLPELDKADYVISRIWFQL
jgi:hypothetical protein